MQLTFSFTLVVQMFTMFAIATLWPYASPANSGPSHLAIIIGNSQYDHVVDLPNAENDAHSVAQEFKRRGYRTVELTNLPRDQLLNAIARLSIASGDTSQLVLYYAGHGFQLGNQSYILTGGVQLHPDRWHLSAVPLSALIKVFSTKPRQKLIFFDACRDNPLYSMNLSSSGNNHDLPAGVLVAFSSQPGAQAAEGRENHSPFTSAFLAQLRKPMSDLDAILRAVRFGVVQDTGGLQVPWQRSSLLLKPALLLGPSG